MRFIILLIAVALCFFIIKKSLQQLLLKQSTSIKKPQEAMLPCNYCQVHVPKSEAIHHSNKYFCKNEHLDAWLKEDQQHNG